MIYSVIHYISVARIFTAIDHAVGFVAAVVKTYLQQGLAYLLLGCINIVALLGLWYLSGFTIYLPYRTFDLVTPASLALLFGMFCVYTWSILMVFLLTKERSTSEDLVSLSRRAITLLPAFWIVVLLVGGAIIIGALMFVIPGVVFAVWFIPALFIFVYENKRGWDALETSYAYAREYFWSILLLLIVAVLFITGVYIGMSGLISEVVVGLNQLWLFEVWLLDLWIIGPAISLAVWFLILPAAVSLGAVSFEQITGRIKIEPVHVCEPLVQKIYQLLPSWGHSHRHP